MAAASVAPYSLTDSGLDDGLCDWAVGGGVCDWAVPPPFPEQAPTKSTLKVTTRNLGTLPRHHMGPLWGRPIRGSTTYQSRSSTSLLSQWVADAQVRTRTASAPELLRRDILITAWIYGGDI